MSKLTVPVVILLVILYFPLGISAVGFNTYVIVCCGSMSPAIKTGDAIISSPVSPGEISVGDVVIFYSETRESSETNAILHRVIEIKKESEGGRLFLTKGDANEFDDGWREEEKIIAKSVFTLPYMGYAWGWLASIRWYAVFVLGSISVGGITMIAFDARKRRR